MIKYDGKKKKKPLQANRLVLDDDLEGCMSSCLQAEKEWWQEYLPANSEQGMGPDYEALRLAQGCSFFSEVLPLESFIVFLNITRCLRVRCQAHKPNGGISHSNHN